MVPIQKNSWWAAQSTCQDIQLRSRALQKILLQVMKFFILFQTGLVERVNWMSGWQSTTKRLGFSNPINLNEINTAENDVTPIFTKIAELCILVQRKNRLWWL